MGSDLCGAHPSTVRPQSQREKETLWLKRSRSTLDLGFSLWPLHCLTPVLPDHGLDSWVWWYLSAFSLVYSPANTVQYHSVFLKVYQKATLGISSCFAMVLTPTHQDVSKITFCWITKGWIKKNQHRFTFTVCIYCMCGTGLTALGSPCNPTLPQENKRKVKHCRHRRV